uniref:Uncharacterized protein n=1 Tax=Myoviridae sp. ctJ2i1 TaxID=2825079 RepID=A0A8S5V1L7_9CAUD|nr:MAG TPA: hypothetical protein [Myoviridae sp. ctJ2i1]DAV32879.1 MAG TPA: hypothetical protein [Caudoviricetes sp.]DAW79625.1 MAG TPA: hypothetical protein [Caudoviricetes sp.]
MSNKKSTLVRLKQVINLLIVSKLTKAKDMS